MQQKEDPFMLAMDIDSQFGRITEMELKELRQKLAEAEEIIERVRQLCDAGSAEAYRLGQLV
jgi:hypothetical protein